MEFFSSFFGGGFPGGFRQGFGGGRSPPKPSVPKPFSNAAHVTLVREAEWEPILKSHKGEDYLMALLLFSSRSQAFKSLESIWNKLSESLQGHVEFYAMESDSLSSFRNKYDVHMSECILLFTFKSLEPIQYSASLTSGTEIYNFIVKEIPHNIIPVDSRSWDQKVGDLLAVRQTPVLVLFSDKTTFTPIFRKVSVSLKEAVLCFHVHSKEEQLVNRFGIIKFPTLLFIHPSGSVSRFTSTPSFESISKFVSEKSKTSFSTSTFKGLAFLEPGCNFKSCPILMNNGVNVILMTPSRSPVSEFASNLVNSFGNEKNVRLLWTDIALARKSAWKTCVDRSAPYQALIIRPKTGKFFLWSAKTETDLEFGSLAHLIERALDGNWVQARTL